MPHTSTHTYTKLAVSNETFNEIYEKLFNAGYMDQLERDLIDMHGLALEAASPEEATNNHSRFGYWFLEFADDQAEWSRATFGADDKRGPIGPLKHMAKEVQECLADPNNAEEYADLLILLLDASRRAGFNAMALLQAARAKMKQNKEREWPVPTKDEPVEHMRETIKPDAKLVTEYRLKQMRSIEEDYSRKLINGHTLVHRMQQLTALDDDAIQRILSDSEPQQLPSSPFRLPKTEERCYLVREEAQVWLLECYKASYVPQCVWTTADCFNHITIESMLIWDSDNGYATDFANEANKELCLAGVIQTYQALIGELSKPFTI